MEKLKRLRRDVGPMKKKDWANISERAKAARDQLHKIQERVDKDPLHGDLRMEKLQVRKTCCYLDKAELSFLKQRAKSFNLNNLDKNSKFFHSIVKGASARNAISFIRREDSNITSDMITIIGDFATLYQDLFGRAKPREMVDWAEFREGPILSLEEQNCLAFPVTKDEIMEAIFRIGNNKAPSPDGFLASFFKKNWDLVGADMTDGVLELFEKGLLLREWNHTTVTLIPKKAHEPTVSDFRPIALYECGV